MRTLTKMPEVSRLRAFSFLQSFYLASDLTTTLRTHLPATLTGDGILTRKAGKAVVVRLLHGLEQPFNADVVQTVQPDEAFYLFNAVIRGY